MQKGDLVLSCFTKRIGIVISNPITILRGQEVVKEWIAVAWLDGNTSINFESQYLEVINENR